MPGTDFSGPSSSIGAWAFMYGSIRQRTIGYQPNLLIRSYRHAAAHVRKICSGVRANGRGRWPYVVEVAVLRCSTAWAFSNGKSVRIGPRRSWPDEVAQVPQTQPRP